MAALARTASFQAAAARVAADLARGHRCVVILGTRPEVAALRGLALAALAAAGETVRDVVHAGFSPTDLVAPGPHGIVAVADIDVLPRQALHALADHLRREPQAAPRARLFLAGSDAFRDATSLPDLAALHGACRLHAPPALDVAEGRAFALTVDPALPAAARDALLRASEGRAALIGAFARAPRLARTLGHAGSGRVPAAVLDHPLGLAAASVLMLGFGIAWQTLSPSDRAAARVRALQATRALPTLSVTPPAALLPGPPPGAAGSGDSGAEGAVVLDDGTDGRDGDVAAATGVTVEHQSTEADAAEQRLHTPHLVAARPGEDLAAMYRRVYRGATPPPFEVVAAVNPAAPVAGARLVFPAPREGWPRR